MSIIQPIAQQPESEDEISDLVEALLQKADVAGMLPTPIEKLLEVSKIACVSELNGFEESFLSRLNKKAQQTFKSAIQKVRGIADLRERVVYVPNIANGINGRTRFVQGHELGHQIMPWHHIDPTYLDDKYTLSPSIQDKFEQEANFFSAQTIFQGHRFKGIALDYRASLDAIFMLADMHGSSRQAAIWHYVEVQDEPIAVAQYYPSNAFDSQGEKVLTPWKPVASSKFCRKYGDIELPNRIRSGHPWVAARDLGEIVRGKIPLNCGSRQVHFQWEAFWNGYALLVLLRRGPLLKSVGKVLVGSK